MFSSLKFRPDPPPEKQPASKKSQSKFYKSISLTDLTDDFFRDSLENNSPFSQRRPKPKKIEVWHEVPLMEAPLKNPLYDPPLKNVFHPSTKTETEEMSPTIFPKFNLSRIIPVQSLKDPIFSFVRKCKQLNKGEMQQNLITKESKSQSNNEKLPKKCNKVKKVSISSDKSNLINESDDNNDFVRRRRSARSYSVPDSGSEVLRVSWRFNDDSIEDQSSGCFKTIVNRNDDTTDQTVDVNTCPTLVTDDTENSVVHNYEVDDNFVDSHIDIKDLYPKQEDSDLDENMMSPEKENSDGSPSGGENPRNDQSVNNVSEVESTKSQDYISNVIDRIEKYLIKGYDNNIDFSESLDGDDHIRDRSKVGIRSSLPFTASSSSTTSGVSSGASDTQSQGSGGTDSKIDSLTPEGCRKGSQGRVSSVQSVSGSGISSRISKGVEVSKIAGDRETTALRQEVETLRAEITKARQTILHMQERDGKRKDRYGDRSCIDRLGKLSGSAGGSRVENVNLGDRRPTSLVRRYAHLYAQTRLDTFDALDSLPDLRSADELKAKLLFSVVVLAFRSVTTTAALLREEIRRILQMMPPPSHGGDSAIVDSDSSSRTVELAISSYIASSVDTYDLTKNVDEVCEQIWATLYDYPSLKMSEALLQYTKDCVRISWGLANQNPPYLLEYENRTFQKELHVRFHTANPNSDVIKTYLWPSLVEGPGGPCVHQGIVMT